MLLQRLLARLAVIVSGLVGANPPALAGSDRSSDTYAGDYSGGSLPAGTFAVLQYLRFAHADAFFNTAGEERPNSHANIFVEDIALASDIYHDFNRFGGLRENMGVELRLLKLFLPPLPPK